MKWESLLSTIARHNKRPGFKFADYELKGVPIRLVMGGRDLETIQWKSCAMIHWKETRSCDGIEEYVKNLLEEIQENIYQKALSNATNTS